MSDPQNVARMQQLVKFIRLIFNGTCKCYENTCEIKQQSPSDPDKDLNLPYVVDKFINHCRSSSNRQYCSTVFDAEENHYCVLFDQYISTFVSGLGLLSLKETTATSTLLKVAPKNVASKRVLRRVPSLCDMETTRLPFIGEHVLKFFLGNGKNLTWENLKSEHTTTSNCFCDSLQPLKPYIAQVIQVDKVTEQDIHMLVRALFWYFRKAIVDNLLKSIALEISDESRRDAKKNANEENNQSLSSCRALSIGSTRITSDYDITVQGDCIDPMIRRFHLYFWNIFGEGSDVVFDTNLYGSSFTVNIKPKPQLSNLFIQENCSDDPFDPQSYWVVKPPPNETSRLQQRMWGLLKVYLSCAKVIKEYDDFNHSSGGTPPMSSKSMFLVYNLTQSILRREGAMLPQELSKIPHVIGSLSQYNRVELPTITLPDLMSVTDIIQVLEKFDTDKHEEIEEQGNQLSDHRILGQGLPSPSSPSTTLGRHLSRFQNVEYLPTPPSSPITLSPLTSPSRFNPLRPSALSSPSSPSFPLSPLTLSPLRTPISSPTSPIGFARSTSLPSLASQKSASTGEQVSYQDIPFGKIANVDDLARFIDMLSFGNFYGNETYFTRGAFVDVVFSQQTCKGKGNKVKIDDNDYIDSFLDNFGDFIAHHFKPKYKKRMLNTLQKLFINVSDQAFEEYKKKLLDALSKSNSDDEILLYGSIYVWRIYHYATGKGYSLARHVRRVSDLYENLRDNIPSLVYT